MALQRFLAVFLVLCQLPMAGATDSPHAPAASGVFRCEAVPRALDWMEHPYFAHGAQVRETTALALHIFDYNTLDLDFPLVLLGRPRRGLLQYINEKARNLPTLYSESFVPVVSALEAEFSRQSNDRYGPIRVEIIRDITSFIPHKNSGALAPFDHERGVYRIQLTLLQQLKIYPDMVRAVVGYEMEYLSKYITEELTEREAHLRALRLPALSGLRAFILQSLALAIKNRVISPFVSDNYVAGKALRRPSWMERGELQYANIQPLGLGQYEIQIRRDPQGVWKLQSERWLKQWETSIIPAAKAAYERDLVLMMSNDALQATMTTEQVYGEVIQLRKKHFPGVFHRTQADLQDRLKQNAPRIASLFQSLESDSFENAVLATILMDYGNNIYAQSLGSEAMDLRPEQVRDWLAKNKSDDDLHEFSERLKQPTTYVHVVGNINSLASDLMVFGVRLLSQWGKSGRVVFLVKSQRVGSDATISDVDLLLQKSPFRQLKANSRFLVVPLPGAGPGTDFRNIGHDAEGWLEKVQRHEAVLFLHGEFNYFSSNRILLDHYLGTAALNIETRWTMGVTWNPDESPPTIVIRVPADIMPYDLYEKEVTLQPFLKARRSFEEKHRENQIEAYAAMREEMEKTGLSFVELADPDQLLAPVVSRGIEHEYKSAKRSGRFLGSLYEFTFLKRQLVLSAIAQTMLGMNHYIGRVYALLRDKKSLGPPKVHEGPLPNAQHVLVNGLWVDSAEWAIGIVKATQFVKPGQAHRPVLVAAAEVFKTYPRVSVVINGLYDATMIVVNAYNQHRLARPLERLGTANFYIDAYRIADADGQIRETGPLYNKGYVGMLHGRLVFGRRRMLGGSIKIPTLDFSASWKKADVIDMPEKLSAFEKSSPAIAVITPMVSEKISFQDEQYSYKSTYFNNYRVKVGHNRINLIIMDDHIHAIIKGDVLMPSLGYVISLDPALYGDFFKRHSLLDRNSGLPPAEFFYAWPKEAQRPHWFAGGGALLVWKGVNQVRTLQAEERNLGLEGWFHRLSFQTQGTTVQDWDPEKGLERGPRSVFGITDKDNVIAAALSGRTARFAGATLSEVVEIIRLQLEKRGEKIRHLINMDGGSSVGFSFRGADNRVYLANDPAPGSTSKGISRPVHTYFTFTKLDSSA